MGAADTSFVARAARSPLTEDGLYVVCTFDRAISIDNAFSPAFVVLRHPTEEAFEGLAFVLVDAVTLKVELGATEACPAGDDVVMNVADTNGIAAVEGGEAWGGAAGVVLPFP